MSIQRKAKQCMNVIIREFYTPTKKIQRQIMNWLSNGFVSIKREELRPTPERFNFSRRFVPLDIQEYIKLNVNTVESLSVTEGKTVFTVQLFTSQPQRPGIGEFVGHGSTNSRHRRIVEALAITTGMSEWSLCGLEHANVVIKIFDVDAPKHFLMDGSPITPSQVNSAYTTPCRYIRDDGSGKGRSLEVVIFRREEWTKVLFHELMHMYSYDISSNDKRINIRLSHIFRVKCDFNLTEAYAEFWARLLWTLWYSDGDMMKFEKEMEKQRQWSIRQGLLVLSNMGLTGNVLGLNSDSGDRSQSQQHLQPHTKVGKLSGSKNMFPVCSETTASFSYYVICGFMMTEWECVLTWCYETNTFPMLFNGGFYHVSSFITLLRELVTEELVVEDWREQLNKLASIGRGRKLTARMTK